MIRMGLIGYGLAAEYYPRDLQFFRKDNPILAPNDPLVEIVAGCDAREEALQRFHADTGASGLYTDYEEMFARERLDAVCIVTTASVRLEPVLAAARHGVHVLCEKPMGTDVATCDAMLAACDDAGVQLVISHQRRTDPMHWHIYRLVKDGLIGELRYLRGTGKPRRGGNELHNIGTHLIDAVNVYGGSPAWVHGYCATAGRASTLADAEPGDRGAGWVIGDRVDVQVGYQGGAQAQLSFSEDQTRFHWELIGSEGRIYFENAQAWHYDAPAWCPTSGTWTPVEMPDSGIVTDTGFDFGSDATAVNERQGRHSRVFLLREFFARMRGELPGTEHTSSGRQGREAIEVIQGTFVSHLSARRVSLPLEDRQSPFSSLAPAS